MKTIRHFSLFTSTFYLLTFFHFSLISLLFSLTLSAQPAAPALEHALTLRVTVADGYDVGATPHGTRRVIPITGGTFAGPRLHGDILPGGADYQLVGSSHTDVEAIYNLRTHDGTTIHIRNVGIASDRYFFTAPRFEAPADGPYAWLNESLFVCRPTAFYPGGLELTVWRVRDPFTVDDVPPLPAAVREPAAQQGTVETFTYLARRDARTFSKHAHVYLPHGYDARDRRTRYDVVYLMHGGGDNSTSFFSDPRSPLPLTQVLDHLIATGQMDPVIVVTPTFYDDDQHIGANSRSSESRRKASLSDGRVATAEKQQLNRMDDAVALTRRFHQELLHDLIPAVERHYRTHLTAPDSASIVATRQHRAFGGFSMGALCTWYQLAYGSDVVSRFLPLSGDCWVYDEQGTKQDAYAAAAWLSQQLLRAPYGRDIAVHAYSGTEDIAGTPERDLVHALDGTAPFRYHQPDANLHFAMKQGGVHYYGDINEYLYHALPLLWPKTSK